MRSYTIRYDWHLQLILAGLTFPMAYTLMITQSPEDQKDHLFPINYLYQLVRTSRINSYLLEYGLMCLFSFRQDMHIFFIKIYFE